MIIYIFGKKFLLTPLKDQNFEKIETENHIKS